MQINFKSWLIVGLTCFFYLLG